ncbi:hypothetical protein Gotur_035897 [Gossypium turneri]
MKQAEINRSFCNRHVVDPCKAFGRRCTRLVEEQRAKFYILRRCVTMLVCWHECTYVPTIVTVTDSTLCVSNIVTVTVTDSALCVSNTVTITITNSALCVLNTVTVPVTATITDY